MFATRCQKDRSHQGKSVFSNRSWIAAGLVLTSAALAVPALADNTADWGQTWIESNRFMVNNNAYGWTSTTKPAGSWMSHFANNRNDYGGSWNHNGGSGGIGVAQINYGKWPWGDWTSNSGLPVQLNSSTDVYSNWSFTKGTLNSTGWNFYYEMWIHNSSTISDSNVTCDLMIHPDYDGDGSTMGNYEGEVNLSGTTWIIRTQNLNNFKIVHYIRKTKTQSTGSLRLDDFWENAASRAFGPIKSTDYVGSVTAALEAFNGSGSYRTTAFDVQVKPPTSTGGSNLVSNPGLESEQYYTQTPSGWNEWSGQNTNDASYTETNGGGHSGSYHGTHWKGSKYEVYTFQTKTGLANGNYTLKAWVKSGGGFWSSQLEAKDYGGSTRSVAIPTTGTWTQISITNINVTNGQCTIGFWSSAPGGQWMYFDDVEFFKQ